MYGGEVVWVAEEVPLLAQVLCVRSNHVRSAEIGRLVREAPRQSTCDDHDGIDRPTFQQLPETLSSGQIVIHRKREAMADVEIRIRIHLLADIAVAVQS